MISLDQLHHYKASHIHLSQEPLLPLFIVMKRRSITIYRKWIVKSQYSPPKEHMFRQRLTRKNTYSCIINLKPSTNSCATGHNHCPLETQPLEKKKRLHNEQNYIWDQFQRPGANKLREAFDRSRILGSAYQLNNSSSTISWATEFLRSNQWTHIITSRNKIKPLSIDFNQNYI